MKRRDFLGGVGCFALSSLVTQNFALAKKGDALYRKRVPLLFDSYRRARRTAKPLLVLIIPADDGKKYERGAVWGAYLNHGSDRQLAPLAQCEVVCATAAELRKLVPGAGGGGPLAVLVETGKLPGSYQAIHMKSNPIEAAARASLYTSAAEIDDLIDKRTSQVARILKRRIAPNIEVATRRVRESETVHRDPQGAKAAIDAIRRHEAVADKRIDQFSAEIMQALLLSKDRVESRRLAAALAKLVRRELKDERVPGSRWARSGGCGTNVEGHDSNMIIGCGMGSVPEKSQRFLYFFAKGPYE
jgi:hypothetical protein